MKNNTEHLVALDEVLSDFLARKVAEAALMSPYYGDLWKQIEKLMSTGGKRLRPQMCLLSYKAFGGQNVESILPAASAFELLHLSMLIHDDIIDRDYMRYGIDNISGAYEKKLYKNLVKDNFERRHYADSAAMLGGDLLLSESYMLVAQSAISAEKIIKVQELMRQAIFHVIGGELLDTESAFRHTHGTSAESIALYKTASYTFILPMLGGAFLAGLPEASIEYVRDFGRNLGIAFQLRDDLIGVFGDQALSGKSNLGDIREGKSTYMIEQFYLLANDQQITEFNDYFGKKSISKNEGEMARTLLHESGTYDKVIAEITRYEVQARAALEKLPVKAEYASDLERVIAVATKRTA